MVDVAQARQIRDKLEEVTKTVVTWQDLQEPIGIIRNCEAGKSIIVHFRDRNFIARKDDKGQFTGIEDIARLSFTDKITTPTVVTISGTTSLNGWLDEHSTAIDGSKIVSSSIKANKLNLKEAFDLMDKAREEAKLESKKEVVIGKNYDFESVLKGLEEPR